MKPLVVAVAAIGKKRELGYGNRLLWHIPDDLKRFRELTLGHPVIMGWRTFQSILGYIGKPFPGRANIVISTDPAWKHEGVITASSVEDAIEKAKAVDTECISIIGGAITFKEAMPLIDRLCLTLIDDSAEADAFFPEYEKEFTKKVFEEHREYLGTKYTWVDLERPGRAG